MDGLMDLGRPRDSVAVLSTGAIGSFRFVRITSGECADVADEIVQVFFEEKGKRTESSF